MWRSKNTLLYFEKVTNFSRSEWLVLSRSCSGIPHKKAKMAPLQERRMIDRFRLCVKGGDGGNGCASFRRSRSDRRGKPDGGSGGRGGDVILECSPAVWDFSSLQHHINAKRGGHGAPKNMIGSRGADKVALVPVGTVIHVLDGEIPSSVEKKTAGPLDPWELPGLLDVDSSEPSQESIPDKNKNLSPEHKQFIEEQARSSGPEVYTRVRNNRENEPKPRYFHKAQAYSVWEDVDEEPITSGEECEEDMEETEEIQYDVAELTEPGQQITIAQGGVGGLGNIRLARGSKVYEDSDLNNEASDDEDRTPLNIGLPGTEVVLLLELKSIADVGLVGMPNAGKSTLLGAISRAKPVVGHYAFTTLRPNLGKLNYDDLSITVADIPGLIRGAHENRGLGHAFLRHVERTKVLAYVVDLAAAIDGRKGIPPWEQLRDLMLELECYREGLSERPSLVVANKIDEVGAEEVYEELLERVNGVPIFPVCAVLEEGIVELKDGLKSLVSGKESSSLKLDDIVLD